MVKKLNVMNDYELFVGAAAPNTYNLAPPLVCDLMQPNNSERLKRQFRGIPSGIHLGTTQSWIREETEKRRMDSSWRSILKAFMPPRNRVPHPCVLSHTMLAP